MASPSAPAATTRTPGPHATHWRYCPDSKPAFDPVVFDEHQLAARGALLGSASAGRGNTHFFALDNDEFALRHYRRGGLIRRLSEKRYIWTGLHRTRAVREFEILRELLAEGVPVSPPFACRVVRDGLFWEGSLVTRKLSGCTLAEALEAAARSTEQPGADSDQFQTAIPWAGIGTCIAQLHRRGVEHADLNAHNIMLDRELVYLIDFDRARRHASAVALAGDQPTRWQRRNIERLRRSLVKLAGQRSSGTKGGEPSDFDRTGLEVLESAWHSAMAAVDRPA